MMIGRKFERITQLMGLDAGLSECRVDEMLVCVDMVLFRFFFFFKQKTAYEIGLGIPAEPLFRSHSFPKHLFQGYLNIYNNYFKAPWMPDRTEANPNELNQDDARYGFRCCHLKNIWTVPLPPETELSRQMTRSEERRVGKEWSTRWTTA